MISALANVETWAFVGTEDKVVKPQSSIDLVSKLADSGSAARITTFEGASHTDVPALAYLDGEINLVGWLISGE